MARFLIDANLPYYFSLWKSEDYIHVKDLNDTLTDEEIWEYAEKNNLTIVSKDSDFSNRILIKNPPPRVIHIKIGNLRINELFILLEKLWNEVIKFNSKYKLVNVYRDHIEGIG
ncbi:MAG: DUF5615 family PIN-like protein [Bacteroidetes bacterium]|nr:DUF5615 family PIN-like protein [Bacteroidota bacterium]MBU2583712.1 DUF5615 family PIN-like protein [Bacteroidota bacterium]